jgi:ABC-type glycerol-3-phosphate transport system permease component
LLDSDWGPWRPYSTSGLRFWRSKAFDLIVYSPGPSIALLPRLPVAILWQRHMKTGLTLGSVKG